MCDSSRRWVGERAHCFVGVLAAPLRPFIDPDLVARAARVGRDETAVARVREFDLVGLLLVPGREAVAADE